MCSVCAFYVFVLRLFSIPSAPFMCSFYAFSIFHQYISYTISKYNSDLSYKLKLN